MKIIFVSSDPASVGGYGQTESLGPATRAMHTTVCRLVSQLTGLDGFISSEGSDQGVQWQNVWKSLSCTVMLHRLVFGRNSLPVTAAPNWLLEQVGERGHEELRRAGVLGSI